MYNGGDTQIIQMYNRKQLQVGHLANYFRDDELDLKVRKENILNEINLIFRDCGHEKSIFELERDVQWKFKSLNKVLQNASWLQSYELSQSTDYVTAWLTYAENCFDQGEVLQFMINNNIGRLEKQTHKQLIQFYEGSILNYRLAMEAYQRTLDIFRESRFPKTYLDFYRERI